MIKYLDKISYILSGKYNIKILIILLLTIVMSVLEVFSIALIVPLMSSLIGGEAQTTLSNYSQYFFDVPSDKFLIIVLLLFLR